MKIPNIGNQGTLAQVQKSSNHAKIAVNHETKIKENIPTPAPKGNTSKIDYKA